LLGEAVGRFILSQINVRAEVCRLFCARYTPRRRRHRACREGSWGGGVLLAWVIPWGGDATCHDGNCTMVWCDLLYFWSRWVNFYTLGAPNYRLRDVVARAGDSPVRLRRQNPERDLASWQNISHRGQFRRRWCLTKLVREGGSAGFGSPVSSVRNV
jgi:hypothetical protein